MTITLTREEAQQVLDALELHWENPPIHVRETVETLRTRLAQPEPEYKSYQCQQCGEVIGWLGRVMPFHKCAQPEPEPVVIDPDGTVRLLKHPPQREWQGLTHEEIAEESGAAKAQNHMVLTLAEGFFCGARWAEAKLKEKNT